MRDENRFKSEHPLTPDEAFMASKFDSFIAADLVMAARKEEIEPYGPLLIGVDPAGKGKDSTAIAWRQGHCITKIEKRKGLTTMEVAGWVASIIREEKPAVHSRFGHRLTIGEGLPCHQHVAFSCVNKDSHH